MIRALITTVPFGQVDPVSLSLLDEAGVEYVVNPIGRRLTEEELVSLVPGFELMAILLYRENLKPAVTSSFTETMECWPRILFLRLSQTIIASA